MWLPGKIYSTYLKLAFHTEYNFLRGSKCHFLADMEIITLVGFRKPFFFLNQHFPSKFSFVVSFYLILSLSCTFLLSFPLASPFQFFPSSCTDLSSLRSLLALHTSISSTFFLISFIFVYFTPFLIPSNWSGHIFSHFILLFFAVLLFTFCAHPPFSHQRFVLVLAIFWIFWVCIMKRNRQNWSQANEVNRSWTHKLG